jgi:hypothetical protein
MRFTIAPSVPERAVDDGSESLASGGRRRSSASLTRRFGVTVVAAVALVAFGVSGCSDSDGDTETPVASESAPKVPETIAATATIAAEEAPTQSATPEPAAESATPQPSASDGPITVAEADIEAALARDLQAQTGEQFSVDCPGDLVAMAGTQVVCKTIVPTGEVYDVKMTVTSVADGRLNYSMEAAPAS